MKQKKDSILFQTNLKFLMAFIFLGIFSIATFIILHRQIDFVTKSSSTISFMESQYTLIQKTSFLAISYAKSNDLFERKTFREEVHEGLNKILFFGTTSNDIIAEKTGLQRPLVQTLRNIYFAPPVRLNDTLNDYFSAIKKFLIGSPFRTDSNNPQLLAFLSKSNAVLQELRVEIAQYQKMNNSKLVWLDRLGGILFIANLIWLGTVGLLVFLPTIQKLGEYFKRLTHVNQELEEKVAERTAELQQKAAQLTLSNEELRKQIDERLRVEKELRKSNAFLDSIIENIPHMIFIKDAKELRFVSFNRAGEQLLGRNREELLGKNDYDFFPKDQADFFTSKDRETLNNKVLVEIAEEPVHTLHGTRILHTKKIPVLDYEKSSAYLLGISEDITERIQAEHRLQELSMAMENALDGIARVDLNLHFLNANKAYATMMGYGDPKDLVGLSCLDSVCPEDQQKAKTAVEEMKKSGKAETEVKAIRKDGSIFHLYGVLVRNVEKDQSFSGFYFFAKDVSERKYRESLEIKADFIQMVSHELRTPIHSVKEGISIVLEGLTGDLNEEQKEVLTISKRCVDRLVRLINDVLAFHKLESGIIEFQFKKNDLNRLIRETSAAMRPLAENKNLRLELVLEEPLPEPMIDHDKIIQVLTNFLQNAIKFTLEGSLTVRSSLDPKGIKVSVTDTGIGIQHKDLPKLFRKFGQLEAAKLVAPGGTGLGLAISKKIIEQHHGMIEVDSEYKKGSTFSFTIPLDQPKGL